MIIVSQDKDIIINFNNITSIVMNDVWDDKPGQILKATDTGRSRHTLGYYKDEKRAKDVLQEIIKKYRDVTVVCDINNNKYEKYDLPKVFEMPKE